MGYFSKLILYIIDLPTFYVVQWYFLPFFPHLVGNLLRITWSLWSSDTSIIASIQFFSDSLFCFVAVQNQYFPTTILLQKWMNDGTVLIVSSSHLKKKFCSHLKQDFSPSNKWSNLLWQILYFYPNHKFTIFSFLFTHAEQCTQFSFACLSLYICQVHFYCICHGCCLWKCWHNLFWFWDGEEEGTLLALVWEKMRQSCVVTIKMC